MLLRSSLLSISFRDHSSDPSHFVEDDLEDSNPEADGHGVGSPDDSGACYPCQFLDDSFALQKTKPACLMSFSISNLRAMRPSM
jgi:hypothetical protein